MKKKIEELMTTIRKMTVSSPCIEKYGQLLEEISEVSPEVVDCAISDMNRFIQESVLLFREIDKITLRRFKSEMLTDSFICPKGFFRDSMGKTKEYLKLSMALNERFIPTDFQVHGKNRLGELSVVLEDQDYDKILEKHKVSQETVEEQREICRKVILLWNYHPAIVKAIIQTKRRALGLDRNPEAKRFL